MSEKPAQKLSESDDFTDNSVDNANDAAREDTSQQSGLATVESEYDTASDSPSDGEEYDDQEEDSDSQEEEELVTDGEEGEEDEEDDDGSDDDVIEVLDNERQSGDGQEQETDSKRKVDDDEDRSNPQYIPKKGTFYEHDDRTLEDEEDGKAGDESVNNDDPAGPGGDRKVDKNAVSKATKKWQASADRWTHDRFDESEQAPKSRAELVSAYGYDIRSEDGPPRARRRRRYARGPNRYTRNWEDEDAYSKSNVVDHNRQRKVPRPEEFPELGTNNSKTRQNSRRSSKQLRSSGIGEREELMARQRPERRTSERSRGSNGNRSMGDRDRERGAERDRYEQPRSDRDRNDRERERNWDREREYDQHGPDNYRDGRNDGGRYSSERMTNNNSYHNKENKISNRGSKEKDRRGSDYKVITSLQFKNQTRNKTMDGSGMPITGGSGGVNPVVHSNSSGALSGSSNSNKMNNTIDRAQPVPDRMLDQRAVQQHHYQNQPPQMIQQAQQHQQQQQAIPHQQQQMAPPQPQVQQAQPQPQQIQHHQQASYVNDDHYDSYSDSKMPKDAKFPYNPPANATIQSVEIGQTDIAKYPTPAGQRTSKDQRQPVLTSTAAVAMNTRSQISPRQIVSTQASQLTSIPTTQQLAHQQIQQQQSQQQQYQLQQQAQYQQLHPMTTQSGPPTATQAPQTQVPPPQLQQQQAPSPLTQPPAAQMHNVHMGAPVSQQQLLANDNNSRSSKRYSSTRQRSTLDNPNVVVVQSPLHEQQQAQLLQQQQQQQLLLQQELQHQQQKLTSQTPKQNYQMNQPTLPLNLPSDYLVPNATQPAAVSKSQPTGQYQHPSAYYSATTPTGSEFVAGTATQPVPVQQQPSVPVVPQPQNPLLSANQYQQYTAPSTGSHQYIQAPPPAAYIPQTTPTPQPTPPTAPAAPPPQMMNYVPTIPPAAPTQYPAAPYTGYQNFNTVVPQPVTPAVPLTPPQPAAAAVYPSGITYYAPQSQTQTPRPLPSQRRPTSAIPILAPPERKSKNNRPGSDNNSGPNTNLNEAEEANVSAAAAGGSGTTTSTTTAGAASDIDHILDNMFVQRPVFQPPIRKSPSPAPTAAAGTAATGPSNAAPAGTADTTMGSDALKTAEMDSLDKIGESVKKLTIQEEKLPLVDASGPEKLEIAPAVAPVDPTAG